MRGRRSGGILVIVLASLIVLSLFLAAIVEGLVADHRQSREAAAREQATWYAESALSRARWQLAKNTEFTREQWQIPAQIAGTSRPVTVEIHVEAAGAPANRREIRIDVSDPDNPGQPVLLRLERSMEILSPGGSL